MQTGDSCTTDPMILFRKYLKDEAIAKLQPKPSQVDTMILAVLGSANKRILPGDSQVREIVVPKDVEVLQIGESPNALYERAF